MAEPVGWLRAGVVDAADPPKLVAFGQVVLGVTVAETAPDVACNAYGPKGAPG